MQIAVLETGVPPDNMADRFGAYPQMLERLLGFGDLDHFAVAHGHWPGQASDYDAYLITGSPAGVYEPLPWIGELKGFLREAKGQAALVGVCFGHQIMAEAFGGQVIKSPKGWGVGLHRYQVIHREPWMDETPSFAIPASHQDQVVVRPPQARVTAASAFTPFAALAYADQPAISFQGHPEFRTEYAQALIQARRGGRYSEDQADAALASLTHPNDSERVGGWIVQFLQAHGRQRS